MLIRVDDVVSTHCQVASDARREESVIPVPATMISRALEPSCPGVSNAPVFSLGESRCENMSFRSVPFFKRMLSMSLLNF